MSVLSQGLSVLDQFFRGAATEAGRRSRCAGLCHPRAMRFRTGRPDLAAHARLFDLPDAGADPPGPSVTFLGVSTLLISDGRDAVMTDGFFSRPSLARTALRPLAPDNFRIDAALARAGVDRLDAVIPVHTHYDHALDSATVAARTGATLVGGRSAVNLARAHGLADDRIQLARPGEPMEFGGFEVTLIEGRHCPPDRSPGEIADPPALPARVRTYRCGEAWSIVVAHRPSGQSLLVVGSAGFVPDALAGHRAEVGYLGVGQLGIQPTAYLTRYWDETVRTVQAQRVVLTHWDDFFRPLDVPLRAISRRFDDLDRSISVLSGLARADGVALHLPTLWQRADPWAGLLNAQESA